MQDNTRNTGVFQKKGVCVAVIPFVEADVLADGSTGSFFVNLPERVMIMAITSNITTASGTAGATVDVEANGTVVVNEMAVAAANVTDETLVDAARYLANGGQLALVPGATAPAAGDLVGEVIVEYIELDKNTGEYTDITQ